VLTWFGNLDGGTQTLILTVLGLVAAISPVLSLISLVTGAAAALSMGTLTLIGTIGGVIAIIAAVVAAGVLLYQNWDTIKEKASELWETIKTTFNNMLDSITETMGNIKDAIVEGWEAAIQYIKELPAKAISWGSDIINGMIDGIKSKMGGIGSAISGVAGTISSFIHFSEPDVGPLKDVHTFMPDMMQMMADGIADNTWRVENAINATAGAMAPQTAAADYSPITGRLDSLIGAAGTPVAVNVVLQGDAAGVFKLVRGQNSQYIKSTGRSGF
jgi:phage-related protein